VGRRVLPRLVQAGYEDLVEAVLVRNPARYLSTASRSANRTLPKEREIEGWEIRGARHGDHRQQGLRRVAMQGPPSLRPGQVVR